MERLAIILILICFSCGEPKTVQDILTRNSWTIKEVANIDNGELGPEDFNKGTMWSFKKDKSFSFETDNDFSQRRLKGTWSLNGDDLTLIAEKDTTVIRINRITNQELVWTVQGETELRFTLGVSTN